MDKTGGVVDKVHYSGPSGGASAGHGYGAPAHVYSSIGHSGYGYTHPEPPYHHSGGGGGDKKGIALSALTLLAFLFFLHILQTCLHDQMDKHEHHPMQVMMMTARGESKIDANRRKGEDDVIDSKYRTEQQYNRKQQQTTINSREIKRKPTQQQQIEEPESKHIRIITTGTTNYNKIKDNL